MSAMSGLTRSKNRSGESNVAVAAKLVRAYELGNRDLIKSEKTKWNTCLSRIVIKRCLSPDINAGLMQSSMTLSIS